MRFLRYVALVLGLYVAVVVAVFLWGLGTATLPALGAFNDRLFKPVVGYNFSVASEFASTELTVNGESVPQDTRFSYPTISDLSDFDRIVFLLEGFESARSNELMTFLGMDTASLAGTEAGNTVRMQSIAINSRLHPLPIRVDKTDYIVTDFQWMRAQFREDCLIKLIQDIAADHFDQEFRDSCAKTK